MKTNELKKGMRIQLANGWKGTMADNMKGNTRLVEVEGIYTETGSVYSHDIVWHIDADTDVCTRIEHTVPQLKLKMMVG